MIDANDVLNGSYAGPIASDVQDDMPQSPASESATVAPKSAGMSAIIAWLVLLALLVFSSVLTLSFQA